MFWDTFWDRCWWRNCNDRMKADKEYQMRCNNNCDTVAASCCKSAIHSICYMKYGCARIYYKEALHMKTVGFLNSLTWGGRSSFSRAQILNTRWNKHWRTKSPTSPIKALISTQLRIQGTVWKCAAQSLSD